MNKSIGILILILTAGLSKINFASCTIFSLSKDNMTVYGQNLDWHDPVTGYVFVNKRGVLKSVLHWKGHWPAAKADIRDQVQWESKYGSITFSYLGLDFVEGGMNEVGLMVDEASLYAKYPPDDGRPGISCGQWMQYQLDNYETVMEVLDHLGELRPDGEGWHYLIADRFGNACAIEYLDGKARVYQGESLKFPVLTNTTYTQAMSHIPMDKAFGGKVDISAGTDSYGRFVKTAALIKQFELEDSDIVEYAFHILSQVSNETTRRSVVYDSQKKQVLWKSENNEMIRWLDLNQIDFAAGTPTLMVHADSEDEGMINSQLVSYHEEIMSELLFDKFKNISQADRDLLKRRGYSLQEVLEYIIQHPLKYMIE